MNEDPRVIQGIDQATRLHRKGETESAIRCLLALVDEFQDAAGVHAYISMFSAN